MNASAGEHGYATTFSYLIRQERRWLPLYPRQRLKSTLRSRGTEILITAFESPRRSHSAHQNVVFIYFVILL